MEREDFFRMLCVFLYCAALVPYEAGKLGVTWILATCMSHLQYGSRCLIESDC